MTLILSPLWVGEVCLLTFSWVFLVCRQTFYPPSDDWSVRQGCFYKIAVNRHTIALQNVVSLCNSNLIGKQRCIKAEIVKNLSHGQSLVVTTEREQRQFAFIRAKDNFLNVLLLPRRCTIVKDTNHNTIDIDEAQVAVFRLYVSVTIIVYTCRNCAVQYK